MNLSFVNCGIAPRSGLTQAVNVVAGIALRCLAHEQSDAGSLVSGIPSRRATSSS